MPLTAERTASHELWADVHGRLRAFVGRRVTDPHTADDLAQDVLLRLHRNLGQLRDDQRLDAFAYAIARNAITDHYRAQARRRRRTSEVERRRPDFERNSARSPSPVCSTGRPRSR